MSATDSYTLLACKGWGSAMIEASLVVSGLPWRLEEADYAQPGPARERLLALNPLAQIPVLLLPGGTVLTETAAMMLHLADRAPDAGLAPSPDHPARPAFLRWLVFLVAAVYPNFVYGDEPQRYVSDPAAGQELRASTDAYAQRCWRMVEASIEPAPWFLGHTFSALDIFTAVMTRWRPGRPWFAEHCPKLHGIGLAADAEPRLVEVWTRNFGRTSSP